MAVAGATSVSATVLLGARGGDPLRGFRAAARALTELLLRGRDAHRVPGAQRRELPREPRLPRERRLIEWMTDGDGDIIYAPAEKRMVLDFYKNNTIHFFLLPSLVAHALRRGVPRDDLQEEVWWWLDLFRWEFPLPERESGRRRRSTTAGVLPRSWRDRRRPAFTPVTPADVRGRDPRELPRGLLDRREDSSRPRRGRVHRQDGHREHAEELHDAPTSGQARRRKATRRSPSRTRSTASRSSDASISCGAVAAGASRSCSPGTTRASLRCSSGDWPRAGVPGPPRIRCPPAYHVRRSRSAGARPPFPHNAPAARNRGIPIAARGADPAGMRCRGAVLLKCTIRSAAARTSGAMPTASVLARRRMTLSRGASGRATWQKPARHRGDAPPVAGRPHRVRARGTLFGHSRTHRRFSKETS